jgi:AhpD family alkylhydroperoxidase
MPRLKRLELGQGTPEANELMSQLDKAGMLLNIFRGMANSAAVLDGYLKFSGALGNTKLDGKTRHAIALAIGQANQCEYCVSAHTLLGGKVGLDADAAKQARQGKSSDAKTAAAVKLALALNEKRGKVSDGDVAAARSGGLDDGEIAEVVALVALNVFTNYFNHVNATDVDLPKVSLQL